MLVCGNFQSIKENMFLTATLNLEGLDGLIVYSTFIG
jgi:hypothetical protein